MNDDTTRNKVIRDISGSTWQDDVDSMIKSVQIDLGPNNQIYQILVQLFEKAKEQEESFKKQTGELETIKNNTEDLIRSLKIEAEDYGEKIKKELDLWRVITMGITLVTAIGFIALVVDTFGKRGDDFNRMNIEYNDRVNALENENNLIKAGNTRRDEETEEQQNIIESFKAQQNCLEGKKYWQYEQCFNK